MSYRDYFNRWNNGSDTEEIRIYHTICKPESLDTAERIRYYDGNAAAMIAECQALIASMQEYRQDLAARYAELETMTYTERLELERHKSWGNGPVTYFVRIVRTFADGTKVKPLEERYTGQQRREGIARYEEIKKQRPGIEAIKDIERKPWER